MSDIKYPNITVRLIGTDGNAFAIIGKVARALRREAGPDAAAEFQAAALSSGSYDELLQLCIRTVNVE